MYALVNEVSDLKHKSYYNQRLLKVPKNNYLMRRSKNNSPADFYDASTNLGTSTAGPRVSQQATLTELNEGIILQSLDK